MLDKFAEELKAAREKKGITLQQMAAKTRIDIKFLEAIDNGNFGFLPELYVKAFIKQYAKVVGLDETETVNRYQLALEGKLIDKQEPQAEESTEDNAAEEIPVLDATVQKPKQTYVDESTSETSHQTKSGSKAFVVAGSIIAAVILITAVVYFAFINKGSEIIVEEKPFEEVIEQTNQRFVEDNSDEQQLTTVAEDSLVLVINNTTSTDSAWVLVIYDDVKKEDFLLFPNSGKTIKAKDSFKLTLGNSGVVSLILNEQPMEFEGRKGSVRHFKIDKHGIERLFSPPTLQ